MRALEPEVFDTVFAGIRPLLPVHNESHPLGCHRPRAADRDCFEVMLVRLVTGCSWEDAEHLCQRKVSDTTARARRDEWAANGEEPSRSGQTRVEMVCGHRCRRDSHWLGHRRGQYP
jgi:transposase